MLKYKKGLINTWDISDGAITTSKIADRAVTDAKISNVSIGKVTVDANKDFNAKDLTNVNVLQDKRNVVALKQVYDRMPSYPDFLSLIVTGDCNLAFFDSIFCPDFGFGNALLYAHKIGTLTATNVSNAENAFTIGDVFALVNTSNGDAVIELTGISIDSDSWGHRRAVFIIFRGIGPYQTPFTVNVKVEVADKNGTWHVVDNRSVSIGYRHFLYLSPYLMNIVPYPDYWPLTGLRITFSNSSVNPFEIRRIGILTTQSKQKMPFIRADGDTMYGNLNPGKDNAYDIGSDTLRWRRVRAVTVSTGDIELANDWRITELENGVVIKNQNGEEIFKITEDGLWFKGNKIA